MDNKLEQILLTRVNKGDISCMDIIKLCSTSKKDCTKYYDIWSRNKIDGDFLSYQTLDRRRFNLPYEDSVQCNQYTTKNNYYKC